MDPWKESAAWNECRDVLRAWAELEGKSATTSDDLYRSLSPRQPQPKAWTALGFLIHAGVWLLETLRFFRSG